MSEGEVIVLFISLAIGGWSLLQFGKRVLRKSSWRARWADRRATVGTPVVHLLILWAVLRYMASWDVREAPLYLFLYMALGLAWWAICLAVLEMLGLSWRFDVIERNNRAADLALAGGVLGMGLCYTFSNVGDGPGWWAVLFPTFLSAVTWALAWILLHATTAWNDRVTIDRDPDAGVRLGGYFVGSGLIFGWASAGDWVSVADTWTDFLQIAVYALPLMGIAGVTEKWIQLGKSRHQRPRPGALAVALFYVLYGLIIVGLQKPL